jgi:hypothetical protein
MSLILAEGNFILNQAHPHGFLRHSLPHMLSTTRLHILRIAAYFIYLLGFSCVKVHPSQAVMSTKREGYTRCSS